MKKVCVVVTVNAVILAICGTRICRTPGPISCFLKGWTLEWLAIAQYKYMWINQPKDVGSLLIKTTVT
jgi:hypothetical protein